MNGRTGEKIIVKDEQSELFPYSFSGVQIVDPEIFKYFRVKIFFR